MNMHLVDWLIVLAVTGFFMLQAWLINKKNQSIAGFLAADRCANRYLLTIAEGMAGLGAISIIAAFQMSYKVGFSSNWWNALSSPVNILMMLTGWIIYRFRQTRALTMAQFFEMRYSRNFRIFAGIICSISGLLNFGIFPAISANFFLYYCGLPERFSLIGINVSTYYCLIITSIVIATYFVFSGGQITIIITDFFQGFFCNLVLVTVLVFLLFKFPVAKIFEGLQIAAPGKSMINPFNAGGNEFTPWYFVIGILGLVFNRLSWQGTQAYNSSAKTPHEAKMAGVLSSFRQMAFLYSLVMIPLVAYLIMNHPEYAEQAKRVTEKLSSISNEQVRDQLLVPTTMLLYLPIGLVGAFVAVMFAADVSTNSAYLHSWSSIIVQDVIIPIRKKILSPKEHFKILRWSIICVSVYVSLFSCFFQQTQHIYYWFAMTGAIWLGGAGAVIIGGLYTTWGNTRGAYAALITGSLLASGGVICEGLWSYHFNKSFIFNGQEIYFFAMVIAIASYIVFSLIGKQEKCNLNKILNVENAEKKKISLKEKLGITDEFTKGDKVIYGISIGNCLFFFFLWCVFTVLALLGLMNDARWVLYFKANMYLGLVLSFITATWLTLGGVFGYLALRKDLKNNKIDVTDDGTVFKENKDDLVDDDQVITNTKM